MGRARTILGTVIVATASLANAPGAGAQDVVEIPVTAVEIERLPAPTFDLMKEELDALVEPTALRVKWRRASPAAETRGGELRVVFLDGPGRGLHADPSFLAAARHALPAPTIWVYTPSVRAALGPGADASDSPAAQRALGLALGRVLAHELVHVLAPDVPHGHGLMAERFRLVALDHTRPALLPACARALDDGARAWAGLGPRASRLRQPVVRGAGGFSAAP